MSYHATISYFGNAHTSVRLNAKIKISSETCFNFTLSYYGQRQLGLTPYCNPYPVLRWLYAVQLCLPHWDKSLYPQAGLLLKLKPLCRPSEEHEEANSPHWSSVRETERWFIQLRLGICTDTGLQGKISKSGVF